MDVVKYFKGTDLLEIREEKLFSLIDKLEKDVTTLFEKVIDTKASSTEEIISLSEKYQVLSKRYQDIKEAFDYLLKLEEESYDYACRRFQLKRILTIMTTIFSFLGNALIGILGFIALNDKASKDFVREIKNIEEMLEKFDSEKLSQIEMTLATCFRMISRKQKIASQIERLEGGHSNAIGSREEKRKELPLSEQKVYEWIKQKKKEKKAY